MQNPSDTEKLQELQARVRKIAEKLTKEGKSYEDTADDNWDRGFGRACRITARELFEALEEKKD